MSHFVFVYGSLKKGYGNHGLLVREEGVRLGEAVTSPIYTLISMGSFPAVLSGGETAIQGEVYEVDRLEALDGLEGHPHFYKREQVIVTDTDGDELTVWMYILTDGYLDRREMPVVPIESGFWENPYG